jgi:PleD family two-component response regulator
MRILVVDDDEDSRDLTEGALLSAGYTDIATAASALDALKVLDVARTTDEGPCVDMALLDIVMPEVDGVELCARIRNDQRFAELPVIMVTALSDMDSLANAFVAGATDYVTKPVNRVELVARVRAALRLKQELDRRQARERELLAFLSSWGDRRAGVWVDDTTGLLLGEAAEAYLAACGPTAADTISVLTLMLDRFDVNRPTDVKTDALALVARGVRRIAATIGVVAAAYKNGMIVLVAPELGAASARELGEQLRTTVQRLQLPNSESVASDYVTASVAAVTGHGGCGADRIQLLTQAISTVQQAAAAGGNRVVTLFKDGTVAKSGVKVSENIGRKHDVRAVV